ncbi:hypothetical protein SPBR_04021 [Sporothrix brasiliensis 5110]|uniref:Uncharacterized protein n=1 Tax=Sporothrix brasiliensis 5110 TaxID=1398154 RepID=A0A0C2J1S3_9PEZI|nr:uncharacterized protein SPBR_04021 [Sporothrix brasiliensis 5110]KIH95261.1 hypothetical protein SPBR_04021 [Sporothrix brasiliensis 5110]
MSTSVASKALGSVVSLGLASAVATYVYGQLHTESKTLDRVFSAYNTPESEASRQRVFDGAIEDPRNNLLNFLSWKK